MYPLISLMKPSGHPELSFFCKLFANPKDFLLTKSVIQDRIEGA